MRDDVARKNAMRGDKQLQQTSAMDFQVAEGDEVSFEGNRYTVRKLRGEFGAVTATIERAGAERDVRVAMLRETSG